MENKTEVKALFTIDDETFFEGTYDPKESWNGFAVPSFDWANALAIARWVNRRYMQFGYPDTDSAKALIRESARQIHIIENDGVEVYDGPRYTIGSGGWCWTVKE